MELLEMASQETEQPEIAAQDDWTRQLIALAQRVELDLGDSKHLDAVASRLLAVAREWGASSVVGASRLGERLAGAVATKSKGTLGLWSSQSNGTAPSVVVVDALLASGSQIGKAIRAAKEHGAARTMAIAVVADGAALELARRDVGERILALEEI